MFLSVDGVIVAHIPLTNSSIVLPLCTLLFSKVEKSVSGNWWVLPNCIHVY